jgi:hypothetical protein
MTIIKSFEDKDYAEKYGYDHWYWGLGDDGNIYRRANEAYSWVDMNALVLSLYLGDMKKLVKEFGHLVVFL